MHGVSVVKFIHFMRNSKLFRFQMQMELNKMCRFRFISVVNVNLTEIVLGLTWAFFRLPYKFCGNVCYKCWIAITIWLWYRYWICSCKPFDFDNPFCAKKMVHRMNWKEKDRDETKDKHQMLNAFLLSQQNRTSKSSYLTVREIIY